MATTQSTNADATESELARAHRLQLAVTRLARRMRREVQVALTPSQASALSTIRLEGPITLGELAERERVAPPSITNMVGRLEKEGYVRRVPDPGDARVCRVETTPAAEAMVAEARQRKASWLIEAMQGLEEADRRALWEALGAIEALVEPS